MRAGQQANKQRTCVDSSSDSDSSLNSGVFFFLSLPAFPFPGGRPRPPSPAFFFFGGGVFSSMVRSMLVSSVECDLYRSPPDPPDPKCVLPFGG